MNTNFPTFLEDLQKTFLAHWKAVLFAVAVVVFFYVFMVQRDNNWISWALAVIPCTVILVTAVCRVNDLSGTRKGWHWQARRVGLTLSGSGAAAILIAPFSTKPMFPSWEVLIMVWGLALTWFTTPNMVPWWRYITGITKEGEEQFPQAPGDDRGEP